MHRATISLLAAAYASSSAASETYYEFDLSDRYLVTLNPGVDVGQHLVSVKQIHPQHTSDDQPYLGVLEQFSVGHGHDAYMGHLNSSLASLLKSHDDVAVVEPNRLWTEAELTEDADPCENACERGKSCSGLHHDLADAAKQGSAMVRQTRAPYNLALISNRSPTASTYWYHQSAGAGTHAYVIDGGINTKHVEFGGRASLGYNALPLDPRIPVTDTTGHGTFVAGIIGGHKFGVAKACNIIAVKATHNGRADTVVLMRALQWASRDIVSRRREARSVVIMALTIRYPSEAINRAIENVYNRGVVTVAAAWDRDEAADLESPGAAGEAITVGSTDRQRRRAPMSNWGKAVDMFAPGVAVCAASSSNDRAIVRRSGTSAAAAHVAGIVIYLRGYIKLGDYARVTRAFLDRQAIKGVVGDAKGSRNAFAYNGSGR